MDTLVITEREGKFEVVSYINILGDDILVVLAGGKEHIGAIGMSQPRASLMDTQKISATSSVFTYIGHKEDAIVKTMSEELTKFLNKKVVVVAGLHWDKLKKDEIQVVIDICMRLTKRIAEAVRQR